MLGNGWNCILSKIKQTDGQNMVRVESATKYHILQLHNWKKKIKKNFERKKIQSHIKRKIDVLLEQEMDDDDMSVI